MANLTYRVSSTPTIPGSTTVKGSGLTNLEIDANIKALADEIATKQASLVSNSNIKTVGGNSLLGTGDVSVQLPIVIVSTSTVNAIAGNHYVLTYADVCTVTLPTTLVAGDPIDITPVNGLKTNIIDVGTKTLYGPNGNMTGLLTMDLGAPMQLRAFNTTSWSVK